MCFNSLQLFFSMLKLSHLCLLGVPSTLLLCFFKLIFLHTSYTFLVPIVGNDIQRLQPGLQGCSLFLCWQFLDLSVDHVGDMYFLIEKILHEFNVIYLLRIMGFIFNFKILYLYLFSHSLQFLFLILICFIMLPLCLDMQFQNNTNVIMYNIVTKMIFKDFLVLILYV